MKIVYVAAGLHPGGGVYHFGRSLARHLSTQHELRVCGAIVQPDAPIFQGSVPDGVMSADTLDEFDVVYMEAGWNADPEAVTDGVRFPLELAEPFVRRGGQLIVADVGIDAVKDQHHSLAEAARLFGANVRFDGQRGVRCLHPPASAAGVPLSFVPGPPEQPVDAAAASAELATLPVKGRAPKTGYDRGLFGEAWTDNVTVPDGHNGCDTRNDILARDLLDIVRQGDCTVMSGVLHDPYSGTTVEFHRGRGTSSLVPIDHVVALLDAWQKGAQQWDAAKRRNFANDPINLQATTRSMNEQKGAGDAATWLPPNKSYRCTYVSRIVDVKATYGLWVTQAEHDAIARILTNCGAPAEPPPAAVTPPPPETRPEYVPPPPTQAPGNGSSVYYPNCTAARAAGVAPLHVGQPGYRPGLDRDHDGVACER